MRLPQPKTLLWLGGGMALLGVLFAARRPVQQAASQLVTGYDWGEVPRLDARTGTWLDRDPSKLVPSFARKIDQLFRALRAQGYDPVFWEGYRSPERAAEMARLGVGIKDSMHSYGAAADIIDRAKLWNAPAFFKALGAQAKALGLTWGGDWTRGDLPHVQAIPVTAQNALRAAPVASRDAVVRRYLA